MSYQDPIVPIESAPRKHIYKRDYCAGCGAFIEGSYIELGLPNRDNTAVTHIALCDSCRNAAENEGVI